MGRIVDTTLTASGTYVYELQNNKVKRNIYTVHIAGTSLFGSGTVTAFTNTQGRAVAVANTTYDVAILDSTGAAISKTANASFDFECNSDNARPAALKIVLAGATNPAIKLTVDDGL